MNTAYFIWVILYAIVLKVCVCYEVEVKIISDDNVVEEFVYRWGKEEPPFRQNTWEFDMDLGLDLFGNKTNRLKRQQPETVVNRSDPNCASNLLKMRQSTKNKPVQLALAKEIGQPVTMTCHYCGDSKSDIYGPAIWFKLGHQETSGIFSVSEVEIDMHDDEIENRVTMTVDHSLVIQELRESDVGSYFCRLGTIDQDRYVKEKMSRADVSTFLSATDRFRFIYHIDILMPSNELVVGVSQTEDGYEKPAPEVHLGGMNVVISTEWQSWGPCSVCDQPGERRRHGLCVIKKSDQTKHTHPWHFDAILTSYYGGVPCRSRLFASNPGIETRPDEVEVEVCDVKCQTHSMEKGKTLSSKGLDEVTFGDSNDAVEKSKPKDVKEKIGTGSQFEISCPGATIDTDVNWVIDSNYYSSYRLRNASRGRVEINIFGKLVIHTADVNDTGNYACWHGGQKRLTLDLLVLPRPENKAGIYLTYLLLSHVINFFVFLLCMIVKHKHRQIQIKSVQRRRSSKHISSHQTRVAIDNVSDSISVGTKTIQLEHIENET